MDVGGWELKWLAPIVVTISLVKSCLALLLVALLSLLATIKLITRTDAWREDTDNMRSRCNCSCLVTSLTSIAAAVPEREKAICSFFSFSSCSSSENNLADVGALFLIGVCATAAVQFISASKHSSSIRVAAAAAIALYKKVRISKVMTMAIAWQLTLYLPIPDRHTTIGRLFNSCCYLIRYCARNVQVYVLGHAYKRKEKR